MWPVGESVPSLPDHRPATYWAHYTTSCIAQSNAPEDGQNNSAKHVELIGNIDKQLLLHLVGCLLYYLLQKATTTVLVMFVRLSVRQSIRMHQLCSHGTYFHEI
jgi:hypothetical protein